MIEKRVSNILKQSEDLLIDQVIECLLEFDYCFKLDNEQERLYCDKGYLFPSLRPKKNFKLGSYLNFYDKLQS